MPLCWSALKSCRPVLTIVSCVFWLVLNARAVCIWQSPLFLVKACLLHNQNFEITLLPVFMSAALMAMLLCDAKYAVVAQPNGHGCSF